MDGQRWPRRGRPQGQPTRGKTAQNRLRRVDLFLAWYAANLLRCNDGACAGAWLVDLGYGAEPFTTLEMAQRLRRLNPRLPVLGVEIDADRVATALPDFFAAKAGPALLEVETEMVVNRQVFQAFRAMLGGLRLD